MQLIPRVLCFLFFFFFYLMTPSFTHFSHSSSPVSALATINLFFASICLFFFCIFYLFCFLDYTDKTSGISIFWWTYFTYFNALEVYLCCYEWQDFLIFFDQIIFYYVCMWCISISQILFIQLSMDRLEKAMVPHSSTLAWKIPWMEEPGRLQSMGLRRLGRDWATSLSLFTFMHWRRKWQPTPVFLPGESQGRGSLVGCRLWDHTELDMTQVT